MLEPRAQETLVDEVRRIRRIDPHHFLDDYEAIVAGDREAWRNTPRGALATLIVLDQFSRNMSRATQMFDADELAREVCHEGLDADFDTELSFDERLFFYLPLEHSEYMDDHRLSMKLFQRLVDTAQNRSKGMPRTTSTSRNATRRSWSDSADIHTETRSWVEPPHQKRSSSSRNQTRRSSRASFGSASKRRRPGPP